METQQQTSQEFEYKAEMKQLLHLIVHSLYTHPEVFLRELVSNASDALNKVRYLQLTNQEVLDPNESLRIDLKVDEEAHTLTIEDTGIGMSREDLVTRIGTVASSGTLDFLEQLRQSGKPMDAQMIGQFGVGFYSAFMVADEITIDTRQAEPDSTPLRWRSKGEGTYTIETGERSKRGTTITLSLKEDTREFEKTYRIRQIVQKYSNFVDFPIYLGDEQINTVKALWQKNKSEVTDEERKEFYQFIAHDYQDPLGHLHLSIEGRLNFRALLFIPATAPPGLFREEFQHNLHLYANNVFIQDDAKTLLPEYLRFIRGVVDTEDLPLNVSREVTQSSPVMNKINTVLTDKVLGLLEEWAEKDVEKYETFYKTFGSLFKMGLNADYGNKERILKLLRFVSTKTEKGKFVSLKDYVSRMKEGQKEIYYLLGDHPDVIGHNPNLEYFRKHDLEVLLLTDPVDVFTIPYVDKFDETPLKSIEKADIDLKQDEDAQKEALSEFDTNKVILRFKSILGDRVEDVIASRRLVSSAATLVVGKQGLDAQMERMMRLMNQEVSTGKKILEINLSHPLIKNLARMLEAPERAPLVEKTVWQLFEGAQLVDGSLNRTAEFVERMTELMVEATR